MVAASGLDYVYPQENRKLFKAVCEHGGAVVSEYPLGCAPADGSSLQEIASLPE